MIYSINKEKMFKKKFIPVVIIGVLILGGFLFFRNFKKDSLTTSLAINVDNTAEQFPGVVSTPSKSLITHSNPAGFSFSYPDNLSLVNNEPKTDRTYADIDITAKGFTKGLKIEISDSSFKLLDDWVKANEQVLSNRNKTDQSTQKETKLGTLKAIEIISKERVLLGALDQGVLFTIDVPLLEKKEFWTEVYNKILENFTFVATTKAATGTTSTVSSSSDVIFEAEEAVN